MKKVCFGGKDLGRFFVAVPRPVPHGSLSYEVTTSPRKAGHVIDIFP